MDLRFRVALIATLMVAGSAEAQNVILVLADDFSPYAVAAYGLHPDAGPTPTLDALAAEGVLFRNVWGYPTCSPTRASILTGRHPARHGVGQPLAPSDPLRWRGMDPSRPNLARTLERHGYRTAALGKWHVAGAWIDDIVPPDYGG